MPIRVIGGIAKGRKLKLVPGDTTRPVMDRVKEAFFNILGRDILDANFLDLFAGTGSVGIEALSRGAKQATFVEIERKAIHTIQDNLMVTKLGDKAIIRRGDALQFIKGQPPQKYDFIYVAPPQYKALWLQTIEILDTNTAWIPPGTTVVVQIDPSEEAPLSLKNLEITDQRRYGNTLLWFFDAHDAQTRDEPQE